MSTTSIDIVHGDGKFELIAQLFDRIRQLDRRANTPFMLTLRGPMNIFHETDKTAVVETEIETLITGLDCESGLREQWRIRGVIRREVFQDRPLLKPFECFEASFNTRNRTGYLDKRSI